MFFFPPPGQRHLPVLHPANIVRPALGGDAGGQLDVPEWCHLAAPAAILSDHRLALPAGPHRSSLRAQPKAST